MRVAILGGGITGVTVAHFLEKRGADYRLFEAAPRLGGLCRSETVEGFVGDCAGGHIIFSKHPEVMEFVLGALEDVGTHQSRRKSAIYYRGDYVQYPFENGLADLPKQDNFECLSGYVEADFARRGGAPEPDDFEGWCRWRFGAGISEKFMYPYNEKIWKIGLDEMSRHWVSGRIPDAPVDDVLRSSIGIRTEGYKHQAVFWYPLTGGFESIVRGVAGRLAQERLDVGHPVQRIIHKGDAWEVDGERFDKVISTIPMPELAKILDDVPSNVAAAFGNLTYTGVISVLVAIDEPSRTDRSWIYFPHEEPYNRCTHLSNYSPGNAPEGRSSIMAEVTYRGEVGDLAALQRECVEHLHANGLLDRERVLFTRAWTNKYAYILYTHGLEPALETVKSWLAGQGIDILGRFGSYNYYNSDQCVKSVMDYMAGWDES